MRQIFLGLMLTVAWMARAGTTVIHVDTEDGGTITTVEGVVQNQKGAMFWNGSRWVTNDTAAHTYFTDLRTGERLLNYALTLIQGNTPGIVTTPFSDIAVVRSVHTYQKRASGGTLRFNAVEYRIARSGSNIVLRSRGGAPGSSSAYFDIYVEDPGGASTTALRADPVWFSYPMAMEQALAQTSPTAYRAGLLPTVEANYFLDMNGGSDMGGVTYQFHTGALPGADPAVAMGTSFPVSFSFKFMQSEGQLQELRFLPHAEGVLVPSPPAPTPLPPTALLVLTGLAGAGVHHFRKRRRGPRS